MFSINLYDKLDDFLFSIVGIPYLCCSISFTIFYSVRRAEILRTTRSTNTCNEFRTSSKALAKRAQNYGCITVVSKRISKYFASSFACGAQKV